MSKALLTWRRDHPSTRVTTRVVSLHCFFRFPLHERRDNPWVGITLPACWRYPSRRNKFQWFQVPLESAQKSNIVYFSQWLRVQESRCTRMESFFRQCSMREQKSRVWDPMWLWLGEIATQNTRYQSQAKRQKRKSYR